MKPPRKRHRLDRRLDAGRLGGRHVRAAAGALAALHAQGDRRESGPIDLARRLRETAGAGARVGPGLERVAAAQRRFVIEAAPRLLERSAAGRTRRLHGRLGCDRVWVGPGRAVRFAAPDPGAHGDVAQDVAALALDLRARRAERRAEAFVAAYALAADDYALYAVLDGYERDAALRLAATLPGRRTAAALLAALDPVRAAPVVIATGGGVASGKSTLAKAVSRRLAVPRVEADRVCRALLAPIPERVAHELIWDPEFAQHVYRGLLRRAEDVLGSGRSVVLDACFPDAERRREAAALAARHGAAFVFAQCESPPAAVEARLRRRDRRSAGPAGGWADLARRLAAQWEPPADGEPGRWVAIDTGRPRRDWLRALGLPAAAGR